MKDAILKILPPIFAPAFNRSYELLRRHWRLRKAADKQAVIERVNAGNSGIALYFGGLGETEPQYQKNFYGLALDPMSPKEIAHNIYDPLPFESGTVEKIQSQDVFEHIEYDRLPAILDDIYRVMAPGAVMRISVPDYRCPALRQRCVFDAEGAILVDTMMGGSVRFDRSSDAATSVFTTDGGAHIWFPTYELMRDLIDTSAMKDCSAVNFFHYFIDDENWVVEPYPDLDMPVHRAPPQDMRADGAPVSIVVDLVK